MIPPLSSLDKVTFILAEILFNKRLVYCNKKTPKRAKFISLVLSLLMMCTATKFISWLILSVFIITISMLLIMCQAFIKAVIISLNHHDSPKRAGAIIILILQMSKSRTERLSDWPVVTQPIGDRARCSVEHEKLSLVRLSV